MKKLLVILVISVFLGCGGGGSNSNGNNPSEDSIDASYAGYYAGTYDNGNMWMFSVNPDYEISGTATHNDGVYTLSGSVDENGEAEVTAFDVSQTARLIFELMISDSNITGTWKEAGESGDGTALTVTDFIQHYSQTNNSPFLFNIESQTIKVGEEFSYSPLAIDTDGDSLIWSISSEAIWLTINSSTGLISGIPITEGTFNTTVTVSDNKGGNASKSFTINVNANEQETTIDGFTRNNIDEIVIENSTRLTWQDNAAVLSNNRNWNNAVIYCDLLVLGGFTDWRLPTRTELESIHATTLTSGPYIYAIFENIPSGFAGYWTSTTYDDTTAFYLNFGTNVVGGSISITNTQPFVRCVREGSANP